jgi:hypothetical protein
VYFGREFGGPGSGEFERSGSEAVENAARFDRRIRTDREGEMRLEERRVYCAASLPMVARKNSRGRRAGSSQ